MRGEVSLALCRAVSACSDERGLSIERLLSLFAWELFHSLTGDIRGLAVIVVRRGERVLVACPREGARLSDEAFLYLISQYERSGIKCLIRDHSLESMCDAASDIRTSLMVRIKVSLPTEEGATAYLWMGLAQAASAARVEKATRVAGEISESFEALRGTILSLCSGRSAIDRLRDYQREVLSFAHDIRAPLGAVRYGCALKAVPDALSVLAVNELAYIEKMLSRLLLVGTPAEQVPGAVCDISAVCRNVLERFAVCAKEQDVSLRSSLPDASTATGISAIDCERVLSNLVGNALRYSKGKKLTLTVRRVDTWLHLIVADDGVGMAPELVERLEAGLEGALPSGTGWGIGLRISKRRIEESGGRFKIESTERVGTKIEIALPADPSDSAATDIQEQVHDYGGSVLEPSSECELFLVDDDVEHTRSLSKVLGLSGLRVRSFSSVSEVIKELPRESIPPIICDINMPDGGAEALLLFLSERRIDAPLAIMSGDSQEERLYHLAARGAEAFFSKPIPVEQMIEWVASLTQTRT